MTRAPPSTTGVTRSIAPGAVTDCGGKAGTSPPLADALRTSPRENKGWPTSTW